MCNVKAIICISGKRKSGKDFVTPKLASLFAERFDANVSVSMCTLSNPLKEEYAKMKGIDESQLKGDGPAKELVREEMIKFGEERRATDDGYFCKKAFARRQLVSEGKVATPTEIVLISDCRRPSDIEYFRSQFPSDCIVCVRIECSMKVRERRGFAFKVGVDNAESECALDGFSAWDIIVRNDGESESELDGQIEQIVTNLEGKLAQIRVEN